MRYIRLGALTAALAVAMAGCGGKPPELMLQRLDPKAPAAAGMPPAPAPEQPVPLTERPPFGLYAEYPSGVTLEQLSAGTASPDGRYKAAMTDQGAWVTRIDGAWLWQIQLPKPEKQPAAPATPATPGTKPGTTTPPPPAVVQGTKLVGTLTWSNRNTLLARDDAGTWYEAAPDSTRVAPLPTALQGKEELSFSPDGTQAMYYVTARTVRQLWLINIDGTKPTLLGENVTGKWGPDGKPIVEKIVVTPPAQPQVNKPATPPATTTPSR